MEDYDGNKNLTLESKVRGQATTKNESQAMCILRGGRSFIKS
jgi:hypothetical protein